MTKRWIIHAIPHNEAPIKRLPSESMASDRMLPSPPVFAHALPQEGLMTPWHVLSMVLATHDRMYKPFILTPTRRRQYCGLSLSSIRVRHNEADQ